MVYNLNSQFLVKQETLQIQFTNDSDAWERWHTVVCKTYIDNNVAHQL